MRVLGDRLPDFSPPRLGPLMGAFQMFAVTEG
jgi:hypothetical protein